MKTKLGELRAEQVHGGDSAQHHLADDSLGSRVAVKVNVIPSSAEATLDCRLLPGTNAEEFLSEIKARMNDPRVTVEMITRAPDPGMSPSDTPLFAALRKAILEAHPDAMVTPMLVPFGTDSVYLQRRA